MLSDLSTRYTFPLSLFPFCLFVISSYVILPLNRENAMCGPCGKVEYLGTRIGSEEGEDRRQGVGQTITTRISKTRTSATAVRRGPRSSIFRQTLANAVLCSLSLLGSRISLRNLEKKETSGLCAGSNCSHESSRSPAMSR